MGDWRSFSIWFYSSSKEILMLRGFEEASCLVFLMQLVNGEDV
jgi:hypothetical protein